MLSHSTETKILLPDFRWWVLKDVDYRGNVFQDPPDLCLFTAVFESYNCNSAGSQWTDRLEPPTGAPVLFWRNRQLHKLHEVHGCPQLVSQAQEPHSKLWSWTTTQSSKICFIVWITKTYRNNIGQERNCHSFSDILHNPTVPTRTNETSIKPQGQPASFPFRLRAAASFFCVLSQWKCIFTLSIMLGH